MALLVKAHSSGGFSISNPRSLEMPIMRLRANRSASRVVLPLTMPGTSRTKPISEARWAAASSRRSVATEATWSRHWRRQRSSPLRLSRSIVPSQVAAPILRTRRREVAFCRRRRRFRMKRLRKYIDRSGESSRPSDVTEWYLVDMSVVQIGDW